MLKKPDPDLQYLLWLTEVAALSPVKGVKLLEAGEFSGEGDIVFVHTGGAAALFAMDLA